MALTDQPYIPFYVDDWLSNVKLKDCSPGAHGLMINVMCLMHKSEEYGKILLKQKYKQTNDQVKNFAYQLVKTTPFDVSDIILFLNELLEEMVLFFEEDFLVCRRMVNDAKLSRIRASIGKSGGEKTQKKNKEFAKAKPEAKEEANTVIVNVNEYVSKKDPKEGLLRENLPVPKMDWDIARDSFLTQSDWFTNFCRTKSMTPEHVSDLQKEFIGDLELKQEYKPLREIRSHFTNWVNIKLKNGTHKQQSGETKLGTSAARIKAARDF